MASAPDVDSSAHKGLEGMAWFFLYSFPPYTSNWMRDIFTILIHNVRVTYELRGVFVIHGLVTNPDKLTQSKW